MTKFHRNRCQYCRLKKCLSVGMRSECVPKTYLLPNCILSAVQAERKPNMQKAQAAVATRSSNDSVANGGRRCAEYSCNQIIALPKTALTTTTTPVREHIGSPTSPRRGSFSRTGSAFGHVQPSTPQVLSLRHPARVIQLTYRHRSLTIS